MRKISYFVMTAFLILGLNACSSKDVKEKANEKIAESVLKNITGKDVDIETNGKDGKVTIKGKNGEEVTFGSNEKELPDDFPSDVYVVDGKMEAVGLMTNKDGKIVTFGVNSTDAFTDIKEGVLKEMKSKGWENTMTMSEGGESVQMYKKDDMSATITISKKGDKVQVAYMVTYKK